MFLKFSASFILFSDSCGPHKVIITEFFFVTAHRYISLHHMLFWRVHLEWVPDF